MYRFKSSNFSNYRYDGSNVHCLKPAMQLSWDKAPKGSQEPVVFLNLNGLMLPYTRKIIEQYMLGPKEDDSQSSLETVPDFDYVLILPQHAWAQYFLAGTSIQVALNTTELYGFQFGDASDITVVNPAIKQVFEIKRLVKETYHLIEN